MFFEMNSFHLSPARVSIMHGDKINPRSEYRYFFSPREDFFIVLIILLL